MERIIKAFFGKIYIIYKIYFVTLLQKLIEHKCRPKHSYASFAADIYGSTWLSWQPS